ncbi:ubiquitin carboxyl-terminal hydrolase 10-like isoform X2 [Amblyomma americanum]
MGDSRLSYEFFNWADIPHKDKEILHEALRNGSDCVELPWQDEPDCSETLRGAPPDQRILGYAAALDPETALGSPLQETFDIQSAYMQPQPIYPPAQYSPGHHHPSIISQEMICDYGEQHPPQPPMALEGMGKRSTGRRGHRNKSMHHTPRPDVPPPPPSEVLERMGDPVRHLPITYAGGQSGYPFASYSPHPVFYMCVGAAQPYYGPAQGHPLSFVTAVVPSQPPHVAMAAASTMAGEPLAPSHFADPPDLSSSLVYPARNEHHYEGTERRRRGSVKPPRAGKGRAKRGLRGHQPKEEVASTLTTASSEEPPAVVERGNLEPEAVVVPAVTDVAPESLQAPVNAASPTPCTAASVPKKEEPAVELTEAATSVERPTPMAPVVNGSGPAMRSWADLFKKGSGGTEGANKLHSAVPVTSDSARSDCNELRTGPGVPESGDTSLGTALHNCIVNHTPPMIQPRGLENGKNWCYINANLQALLACPAFYNLLHSLPVVPGMPGSTETPLMECFIYFLHSYAIPLVRETGKKDELVIGSAYDPEPFRDLLMKIKPDCKKGKQEDAEEFLSFMLNGLHDEMVSSMRSVSNGLNGQCNGEAQAPAEHLDDDDDEGPWKTVSHRNRCQVTRSAEYSRSPLMDIFGGEMRSSVTADGETSASLQPFFTLQLDIQDGVKTVEEALLHLAAEEKVQNYHSSKSNKEVDALRRTTLEKLPQVLILHLKRFVYDKNGGCKKLMNAIHIPHQLQLDRKLVSSVERVSSKQPCYVLFAVLSHSGERTDKGHYVTDAYHPAVRTWLRCDDDNVTPIAQGEQLQFENSSLVPYLLFYQRADTDHKPR